MKLFLDSIRNVEELEEKIIYKENHPNEVHDAILYENIKNLLLAKSNIKPFITILEKHEEFNRDFLKYINATLFSQKDLHDPYEPKKLLDKAPEYFHEGAKKRFLTIIGVK